MRIFKYCSVISAFSAVFALPQPAVAQQTAVEAAPPQLQQLEEGKAPDITISSPETNYRIVEERDRGQVTSVKVESGNSTYYLKPNTAAGSALHDDARRSATRAPQWKILEFDWSRDPEKAKAAAAQAATIAPPPAPVAPPKNQ
ncbi:MAG: hypothetical protein A3I66_18430 [Burkholderiales bacterium RIFCSPLOWO2_02_FULL_57_36]|nr:MAG: hypothetical protein A3I66_18430 [Burkholderiales bacterium RIFCSPLOWO2_02_FULL_57_36]